jgi:hypothetical protein
MITGTTEAAHLAHVQPGTDERNACLLRQLWRNEEKQDDSQEVAQRACIRYHLQYRIEFLPDRCTFLSIRHIDL